MHRERARGRPVAGSSAIPWAGHEDARLPALAVGWRSSSPRRGSPRRAPRDRAATPRPAGRLAARRRRDRGRGRRSRPAAPIASTPSAASRLLRAGRRAPTRAPAAPSSRRRSVRPPVRARPGSPRRSGLEADHDLLQRCRRARRRRRAPGGRRRAASAARREDADTHIRIGRRGRQHEHALGEVHLSRERLHRQRVELARVGERPQAGCRPAACR